MMNNEVRSYDDCKISVQCPENTFAIFNFRGKIDSKAYHEARGWNIEYFSTFWNYWDFRIESDEEIYLNAQSELVEILCY